MMIVSKVSRTGLVSRPAPIVKRVAQVSDESGWHPQKEPTSWPSLDNVATISCEHFPSRPEVVTPSRAVSTNGVRIESAKGRTSTPIFDKLSPHEPESIKPTEIKQTGTAFTRWFSRLTPKQKTLFKIAIVSTLFVTCAAIAILPPVVLLVLRRTNSPSVTTSTTVSACASTTCIGLETPYKTSMITVLYPFDGNTNDLTDYATGTAMGATAPSSYTYGGYVHQALQFNTTSEEYVRIPYVNLAQQSFTLQVWLYPVTEAGQTEFGIFGICDSSSICLSLSLRYYHVALSFTSMSNNQTLMGASVLPINAWTHVTIVYDAVLFQQLIYVNGLIDAVSNGVVNAYQGSSSGATVNIGMSTSLAYGSAYFYGWIDHFVISAGVGRSACEIYNDASLAAYYPFDSNGTLLDHSVNYFNGIASGISNVTMGRVQQAISFSSSTSYFQAPCFPSMRTGNPPFSVSLWVNPTSVAGGSIVHVSTYQNGSGTICYDMLGLTSTGIVVAQLLGNSTYVSGIQGPVLSINTWTHLVVVYALADGIRLFVNGQLSATTLEIANSNWGVPTYANALYVTLANNGPLGPSVSLGCPSSSLSISSGAFSGSIDEFRLYSRQLDAQEICVLANA